MRALPLVLLLGCTTSFPSYPDVERVPVEVVVDGRFLTVGEGPDDGARLVYSLGVLHASTACAPALRLLAEHGDWRVVVDTPADAVDSGREFELPLGPVHLPQIWEAGEPGATQLAWVWAGGIARWELHDAEARLVVRDALRCEDWLGVDDDPRELCTGGHGYQVTVPIEVLEPTGCQYGEPSDDPFEEDLCVAGGDLLDPLMGVCTDGWAAGG